MSFFVSKKVGKTDPQDSSPFLSLITDKGVLGLICSQLEPKDLVNFSLACQKCHDIVQNFNPLGRLETICGFYKEVIQPWNDYRSATYSLLNKIKARRGLDNTTEYPQFLQLFCDTHIGTFDKSVIRDEFFHLIDLKPKECLQVLSKLPSPLTSKIIFVNLHNIVREFKICYSRINQMIFSILGQIVQRKNILEDATDSEIIRSINSELAGRGEKEVSNYHIEEIIFSIVSDLKGEAILNTEEDFKKLIRFEIAKIKPDEPKGFEQTVAEFGQTLEKTFENIRFLYKTLVKIELNQKKYFIRENKRLAEEWRDARYRTMDGISGCASAWSIIASAFAISYLSFRYLGNMDVNSFISAGLSLPVGFASGWALFNIRLRLLGDVFQRFPIQERLGPYEPYTPHPLRNRASTLVDSVFWSQAIILIAVVSRTL